MITNVARWAILAGLTGLITVAVTAALRPPQIPTERASTSTVVRSAAPQTSGPTSSAQPTTAEPQFLRPTPPVASTGHLRPMNDGDRLYHEFCRNHDDSAGCSDYRDDALRRRGIDPSTATPDTPAP